MVTYLKGLAVERVKKQDELAHVRIVQTSSHPHHDALPTSDVDLVVHFLQEALSRIQSDNRCTNVNDAMHVKRTVEFNMTGIHYVFTALALRTLLSQVLEGGRNGTHA